VGWVVMAPGNGNREPHGLVPRDGGPLPARGTRTKERAAHGDTVGRSSSDVGSIPTASTNANTGNRPRGGSSLFAAATRAVGPFREAHRPPVPGGMRNMTAWT